MKATENTMSYKLQHSFSHVANEGQVGLKKGWFSGQKIIYTAVQQMMQVKKELWLKLLLYSSATRCDRTGVGKQSIFMKTIIRASIKG